MFKQLLFGLLIALAVPGCPVQGNARLHATATIVYQEPPQPQVEKQIERPGYFWVKGRWDWKSNQWQWLDGSPVRGDV